MTAPDHTTRASQLRAMKDAPRVKPLEWGSDLSGRWIGQPSPALGNLAFWVFLDAGIGFKRAVKDFGWQYYPTLEAAQAAAQADYTARIIAALEPATDLAAEAADALDALAAAQAENARLREALDVLQTSSDDQRAADYRAWREAEFRAQQAERAT